MKKVGAQLIISLPFRALANQHLNIWVVLLSDTYEITYTEKLIIHTKILLMRIKEMKFLFEGIIFSSEVIVNFVSGSLNRYEFTIIFLTKYLIKKYRECYFFVLENNNFKRIYTMNEKEDELVKILQDAVKEMYSSVTKRFFISEKISMEKMA